MPTQYDWGTDSFKVLGIKAYWSKNASTIYRQPEEFADFGDKQS